MFLPYQAKLSTLLNGLCGIKGTKGIKANFERILIWT